MQLPIQEIAENQDEENQGRLLDLIENPREHENTILPNSGESSEEDQDFDIHVQKHKTLPATSLGMTELLTVQNNRDANN